VDLPFSSTVQHTLTPFSRPLPINNIQSRSSSRQPTRSRNGPTCYTPQTSIVQHYLQQTACREDTRRKARLPPHRKTRHRPQVRRLWHCSSRSSRPATTPIRYHLQDEEDCAESLRWLEVWRLCEDEDPSGVLGGGGQDRQESHQVSAKGRQEIDILSHPYATTFTTLIHVACTRFRWQKTTNDLCGRCMQCTVMMYDTRRRYTIDSIVVNPSVPASVPPS